MYNIFFQSIYIYIFKPINHQNIQKNKYNKRKVKINSEKIKYRQATNHIIIFDKQNKQNKTKQNNLNEQPII